MLGTLHFDVGRNLDKLFNASNRLSIELKELKWLHYTSKDVKERLQLRDEIDRLSEKDRCVYNALESLIPF